MGEIITIHKEIQPNVSFDDYTTVTAFATKKYDEYSVTITQFDHELDPDDYDYESRIVLWNEAQVDEMIAMLQQAKQLIKEYKKK